MYENKHIALNLALEFHKLHGTQPVQPQQVVDTAAMFTDFLDEEKLVTATPSLTPESIVQ